MNCLKGYTISLYIKKSQLQVRLTIHGTLIEAKFKKAGPLITPISGMVETPLLSDRYAPSAGVCTLFTCWRMITYQKSYSIADLPVAALRFTVMQKGVWCHFSYWHGRRPFLDGSPRVPLPLPTRKHSWPSPEFHFIHMQTHDSLRHFCSQIEFSHLDLN